MTVDIASLVSDNLDIWTTAVERKSGAGRGGGKRVNLYGVDRLRALILELAVQGKLVDQDPNDEPASDLLKRIKSEKARLVAAGKAKPGKPLSIPANWPFQIPGNWAWSQLGQVTNYGQTEKADPGSVPPEMWVLELEDVEKGTSRLLERVRCSDRPFQSQKNMFQAGDVVYGKLRPYLDKVIIADERGVCTTEMVPMRGYGEVRPDYIRLFLKTPFFISLATESAHGMNLPRLATEKAREAPFALPPLAEQQRIVAKVDELIALCDALEAESAAAMAAHQALVEALLATLTTSTNAADLATNWARLDAHFDTLFTTDASVDALKRTILELAVRGKLVESDNLSAWTEYKLGTVIGPMDSGWSPACHPFPARTEEVWGVLKTTAVQNLEYQPDQNKELPESLTPRPDAECRAGDILITRAGPTNRVGICCYVNATRPRLMISDKIVRFRPASEQIDGAFLALILSVGPAAAQIEKAKSGMAASQVNISQAKLREVVISLPALAEQRQIVSKVNELSNICDALNFQIADGANTQMRLADAIVERAAA